VIAALAAELGGLVEEAAAEAGQAEEFGPEFLPWGLGEGKAVEGGVVGSEEVVVIGLVVRIRYLEELLGGKGVNEAGVEVGGGEGALDEAVVAAGAFNDDAEVAEVVVACGLVELLDSVVEVVAVVVETTGREEEVAEAVGKNPFRIVFVAIEAGEAEVGGASLFDAVGEVAAGLVEGGAFAGRGAGTGAFRGHEDCLREKGEGHPNCLGRPSVWQQGLENHYTRGRTS
jgi:hypothetical protein